MFMAAIAIAACGCGSSKSDNPLFNEFNTPYGIAPFSEITIDHYREGMLRGMEEHKAEIEAILAVTDEPSFENTILAFDNSGQLLEQVGLVFGMLSAAETNEELQAMGVELMPLLAQHDDAIMLNDALFERIKSVYDRRAKLGLDAEQQRLLEKTYTAFVRSGALLQGEKKERLRQINEELSNTSVQYSQHLLAENNSYQLCAVSLGTGSQHIAFLSCTADFSADCIRVCVAAFPDQLAVIGQNARL